MTFPNHARMTMLANYLEGVGDFEGRGAPKAKFDLGLWMGGYDDCHWRTFKFKPDPNKDPLKTKYIPKLGITAAFPVECQTAGCAVGWATSMPEFNKQNFYLQQKSFSGTVEPFYRDSAGEDHQDFRAIEQFFGLDEDSAEMLFTPNFYTKKGERDPKAVAKRIHRLLACRDEAEVEAWKDECRAIRGARDQSEFDD